jgi:putative intracellular protease/amidase
MQDIILYATDTMADWEYAYLTSGLAMAAELEPDRFRFRVLTDGQEIVSLDDLDVDNAALLVLPGADTWFDGHEKVLALAGKLLERGTPVAGICGATYGLARAGLLDTRAHTSNAPDFLTPTGYAGAERYLEERVVDDGKLITSPATAPVDFSAAIFRRLRVFPPAITDAWYGLYTTGERHYFDTLVGAESA